MIYLFTTTGVNPAAVVQYTFTHKQHLAQHNETEQNIHNNKNTQT